MINRVYRLFSPRQIRVDLVEENVGEDNVIVRPTYLSICAADIRYYTGRRDKEAMKKKLPMALIHEAVGEVIYDPQKRFKKGTKVVMIPNTPKENDEIIKENYLRTSSFKSSGYDGFMQSFVVMNRSRVIKYEGIEDKIAVLLELLSVGINAIDHFEAKSHARKRIIGVWGDGNVGFATSLILKKMYPDSKLIVFGALKEKLRYFSFADETYLVNEIPNDLRIDHAFECVGGKHSEDAIEQIISLINPQGTICLMGVSENNVPINTRMVLEKGLVLLGNSRSSYNDFYNAIKFLNENKDCHDYLKSIISDEIVVNSISDIHCAFEEDLTNEFKTIMNWKI